MGIKDWMGRWTVGVANSWRAEGEIDVEEQLHPSTKMGRRDAISHHLLGFVVALFHPIVSSCSSSSCSFRHESLRRWFIPMCHSTWNLERFTGADTSSTSRFCPLQSQPQQIATIQPPVNRNQLESLEFGGFSTPIYSNPPSNSSNSNVNQRHDLTVRLETKSGRIS